MKHNNMRDDDVEKDVWLIAVLHKNMADGIRISVKFFTNGTFKIFSQQMDGDKVLKSKNVTSSTSLLFLRWDFGWYCDDGKDSRDGMRWFDFRIKEANVEEINELLREAGRE